MTIRLYFADIRGSVAPARAYGDWAANIREYPGAFGTADFGQFLDHFTWVPAHG